MHILIDYVLPFLALISVLVVIHEMGHYLAARMIGLHVTHFSLGMGPLLLSVADRRGCLWQLRALPIGGYVRMLGDADASSVVPAADGPTGDPQSEGGAREGGQGGAGYDDHAYFHRRSPKHRAWVIAAGPLANFVAGIAIIATVYFSMGRPYTPPVVGQVTADSPAEAAGIEAGDRIVSVDGRAVTRFEDFAMAVGMALDTPIQLVLLREETAPAEGTRSINLTVTPEVVETPTAYGPTERIGRIGIVAAGRDVQALGVVEAVHYGAVDTWTMSVNVMKGLGDIIVGKRSIKELGGPVKIAEISGNAAKMSWIAFALLTAVISINLGIVNLLPIPVLDGGHLVLYATEAIRGKPPSPVFVNWAFRGGTAALLVLFACVTFNDVARLVTVHIL